MALFTQVQSCSSLDGLSQIAVGHTETVTQIKSAVRQAHLELSPPLKPIGVVMVAAMTNLMGMGENMNGEVCSQHIPVDILV